MDNLLSYSLVNNPLVSFQDWYKSASNVEQNAQAMAVSTYDPEKKRTNVRYILFKGIIDNKIVFYTNYLSPKAKDLATNPEIALAFYWHQSKRQVRIWGRVSKMSREDSESYFHTRTRESQIASILSHQSEIIEDKDLLLKKYKETEAFYDGKPIPLPDHWGGYLVDPYEYEFFLYGDGRLNDRFQYQMKNKNWEVSRLQP